MSLMDLSDSVAQKLYDESHPECRSLALEWTCDRLIERLLADRVDMAFECYNQLRASGYDITKQFEYNDMDCHAFTITMANGNNGFVHRDQNRNFIYLLQEGSDYDGRVLCIYEYKHEYEKHTPGLPALAKFLRNGSKYNDIRDREFVVQNTTKFKGKTEHTIHNYARIQQAIFSIETLHCRLEEG